MKFDPKSGLGYLRPKNEEQEKIKFKHYWENRNNEKAKIYNPRFSYNDPQRANNVLQDMKIVFSTKYRSYAKAVVEEIIKEYGTAVGYKEQVFGKEINKEEIMEIANKYMNINSLNVEVFFGQSLVTTMTGNGLCLVGTPNYYRDIRFKSLLDHEIGTHYIRSCNQRVMDEDLQRQIMKKRIGW